MTQRYIGGLIYNPPGGYSGYFDGSGDYLSVGSSTAFALGTGDFTWEAWLYRTVSATQEIYNSMTTDGLIIYISGNAAVVRRFGVADLLTSSASINLNTWTHIAVARSGTTLSMWINGSRSAGGTTTNSTNFAQSGLRIGINDVGSSAYTGYISNLRVVKGTAVYDPTQTSITVPNGPLQNITNTSLLTCRYPTFVDGSSNAFTITVNGNTTVSTQNPFPLTTLPNPALGNQGNGIFSMSQYQSLKQQNLWPAIDPYFDYTTLLLHGNGTNGGQNNTFQDSSSNNFTITRNGNTTQGTFSPFSQTGWSNYFDGSSDGLTTSTSTDFDGFGNGTSWQIDFWWFPITGPTQWDGPFETVGGAGIFFRCRSGYLDFTNNNDNAGLIRSDYPSLNTWHHVVLVCDGSTNQRSVFIDGTRTGTITNTSQFNNGSFGLGTLGTGVFNGYLSNFRVIKGSRTYDPSASTITVPTSPSTAVSGTVLLTCQSNRFVDTNTQTTPKTFTVSGNTSVQAFSPFAPTAAYSASTVGGSGYFDGSGDYLTVETAAESALNLTGTFTFEFWFYRNATGDIQLFSKGGGQNNWNTTNGIAYQALIETSTFKWQFSIGGGSLVSIDVTAPAISQWVRVAVGRNGTTTRVWVNGSSIGTSTSTPTPPSTRNIIYAAANQTGGNNVNGYMAGLRIVNGTDVYGVSNTSITVPTSPPTNITNTSLLLNFTNAAIIDNTAKNVLETVGNAQISTTQSKFGGGSFSTGATSGANCLTAAASPLFQMMTGNFTVEGWFLPDSGTTGTERTFYIQGVNTTGGLALFVGTGGARFRANGQTDLVYSGTISSSVFTHIAFVRNGNTRLIFVNGTQVASDTLSFNNNDLTTVDIGAPAKNAQDVYRYYGYIDDLRITKGIARYTSNFTPQTSQWQDQ